jgi:CheY-like chemotaxis protein
MLWPALGSVRVGKRPSEAAGTGADEGLGMMPTRRASVLVVEDEVLISNLIAEVLSDSGFAVHTVASAEEALAYVMSHNDVDVLFTDINLPGGMDGSMLAERVREQRPEMPIVYCSGRYSPSALAPPVPRSVFVKKPYVLADVCTLLERLTTTAH